MSQKSYNSTPSLYLVPTPIGNLDDITMRAVKILSEVEVIFSEDTRETGYLLKHLNIKKKLIAAHEHNEDTVKYKMLEYLKQGSSIALVTDRGTPIISDPGYKCVSYIISQGYNVIGLPGPTALIPALITSGLPPHPFVFYGFLDSKKTHKKKELEKIKKVEYTSIFYESPYRVKETLSIMKDILGNRNISVSREISKTFEEIYRGTVTDVLEEIGDPKGEIVIIVEGNKEVEDYSNLSVKEHIDKYAKEGLSSREAIKLVAKERKIDKNELYIEYHLRK